MARVHALTPWRRTVAVLCFSGLRSRKMAGVIDPEGFTIPRRRACSTRQAIFEVAQLRAARATWAGRTSSVSVNLLRPRGKNPEIRAESMSCVVIIHLKDILFPAEPIVHGGARADIAGPLTLTGRCRHPSGATRDELVPER